MKLKKLFKILDKEGYDKGYEDTLCLVLNDIKTAYAAYFARCMTGGEEDEDS